MSEPSSWQDQPLVEPLTDRELEILSHMARHLTNQEIADRLVLSLNTVKWYARQIYGKLGVDGRREAVARARELGLLDHAAAAAKPVQKLPAQLTPFLGRQEEVAELCRLLSGPLARLLTIVGPGGVGKTRLAIEVAGCLHSTQAGTFRDGVFFVRLSRLDDPSELSAAIAQAMGFQFYQAEVSPERQLVDFLRSKRTLLLLDNFEHLMGPESTRLLTALLTEAPEIRVLVTSRSRLNVRGEHAFPLAGMRVPEEGEAARWDRPARQAEAYSGVQLFSHSARRQNPGFEVNEENLQPIIRICSLVGGLPLAIELAAGWMAVLEPQQIAREIGESLDILATEAANVPERQQSLRAVFDSSWRLLTKRERDAVQDLSVFEGGFDLKAAQRISGLSLQTLLSLVNKSWVQQGAGGHFQLHDLLHRYGQEKLSSEREREDAVRDLHSRAFCDWLSAQKEETWGPRQETVLAAIEADIENVHAACLWAAERGQVRRLSAAVDALGLFYYQWRGNYQAGQGIFRALNQTLTAGDARPAEDQEEAGQLLAKVLGWQATFTGLLGGVQAATDLLHEASSLLGKVALSKEETAQVRAHIAWQHGYQVLYADPATARRHFAEGLALYRDVGNQWGVTSALLGLGRALRGVGEIEEAEEALTSSLSLHRQMGNRHGESETLSTLATVAFRRARFEEAEELIRRSLSITPETDRFGFAFALGMLGRAREGMGMFAEAEGSLRECVQVHGELGMRGFALHWSSTLGWVILHQGRVDDAQTLAEAMVAEARDLEYPKGVTMGTGLLGAVALIRGDFEEAKRSLTESAEAAEPDAGYQYEEGQLVTLGLAARGLGHPAEAKSQMLSGLSEVRRANRFPGLMVGLVGTSLLYADEGDVERAVELYSLASRYGFVANSAWLRELVGDTILEAASRLSPEALRKARERGAARDLDATIDELLADREA